MGLCGGGARGRAEVGAGREACLGLMFALWVRRSATSEVTILSFWGTQGLSVIPRALFPPCS